MSEAHLVALSTNLMQLMRNVESHNDDPSIFPLKEAIRRWGQSNKGGPLSEGDHTILNRIDDDPSVGDFLQTYMSVVPDGGDVEKLRVAAIESDLGCYFTATYPEEIIG